MIPSGLLATVLLSATAPEQVRTRFDANESKQLVPLLSEVLRFPTVAGNAAAHEAQRAWLQRTGAGLGLTVRETGRVTEVEVPGPTGAPVLGLMVHGDVQPVETKRWTVPPFSGEVRDGVVHGRGAADDKGPLVQALLVMSALKASGVPRTHTVRLLVGSDEESGSTDAKEYLAAHAAPDYTLVLDSEFPVVVGEKAWNALFVKASLACEMPRGGAAGPRVTALDAGLAPSIVPDHARLELAAVSPHDPFWNAKALAQLPLPPGIRLETRADKDVLAVDVWGHSAHAGVNIAGGRNALVALANLVDGHLPQCGPADLLAFAKMAGVDLFGTGLGLTESVPVWGRYAVNVATLKADAAGSLTLTLNLRRTPPLTGPQLEVRLNRVVAEFNGRTGASLSSSGFYADEPLAFDPASKLVRRLLDDYERATGTRPPPAISGGGTYAKRVPRAIAFGMWFPGKPYPGHDVDEKVPVDDLQRGARVLIETVVDLATSPPLSEPFQP
jgi:succinyl-diaminopimelate desuccinylase